MLQFIRYYFDLLIDWIFGLYYNRTRKFIENVKNPIVLESALSLAQKIRKRELTSEEVVQAFVDRVNQVNPILNGIVDERFEEALNEAREIDQRIARGEILKNEYLDKPFLGVPFTSKESTSCKGLAVTYGLKKRLGYKATFDADVIAAMKNAGGILLGVSNIPQFNLWLETINPVYGLTRNPYNTTRSVGGSAGGEACILASCGTPIGIGTDIGGSSRIPSFMCGVFGHKMTSNLVGTKGMTFRMDSDPNSMVVVGPMARYADDLIYLVKALSGENAKKLNLDEPVNVKKIKVFYVLDPKDCSASPIRNEMKRILVSAVKHFAEISDTKPEELVIEGLRHTRKIWKYWMSQEAHSNFTYDVNNREGEVNVIKEILRHFTIGGDFTTGTILNFVHSLFPKPNEKWAIEETDHLKKVFLSKLDENSILLYPSAPYPARHHHTAFFRPFNFSFFAIWNILKFPATQVPMGLGQEGLPIGIQVVAAPFQDRLCLAIAKELEKRFGGYVPPFKVEK